METYGLTWDQVDNLGLVRRAIMLGANYVMPKHSRARTPRREPVNAAEFVARARKILEGRSDG